MEISLEQYNKMAARLTELEYKVAEMQWIPVTERLPEKYGWYLCSGKDERVMMRFWNNHMWWDNIRKSMFELYDIYGKLTGQKVTDLQEQIDWTDWVVAWMPLPEPWKGGEA